MAAGASLICDTASLSDCFYRIFSRWASFFGEIRSIPFFVYCFVRKHGCIKTSRKDDTTFSHKSKFSMISYVRCFLETIQRLYLFSRCTKAGLLVRLLYIMKFLLTSLFFRVSSFCFNVSRSFFHGLNRFCTCDVKKHGCWDQFDL